MTEPTVRKRARGKTPRILLTLGVLSAFVLVPGTPLGGNAPAASAVPYINCEPAAYNRTYSASIRCDAASVGLIRIRATCFNLVPFPVFAGNKYTQWESIAAGTSKTMYFAQDGWCTGWNQTWRVDAEIG